MPNLWGYNCLTNVNFVNISLTDIFFCYNTGKFREEIIVHRLLRYQLKKLDLSADKVPDLHQWSLLLKQVSETYRDAEDDIESLEKSFQLSSSEIKGQYEKLSDILKSQLRAISLSISSFIFVLDAKGNILEIYAEGKEMQLIISKEELIGKNVRDFLPQAMCDMLLTILGNAIASNQVETVRYEFNLASGRTYFEARVVPTGIEESGEPHAVVSVRNMSDCEPFKTPLDLLEIMFEDIPDGILMIDINHTIISLNRAFHTITGLEASELQGQDEEVFFSHIGDDIASTVRAKLHNKEKWHGEVSFTKKNGSKLLIWMTAHTVFDEHKLPIYYMFTLTDVTSIKKSHDDLIHHATHDPLTGLPNRILLHDRLKHAIQRSNRPGMTGAVLFLDLDHFKAINDNYGHDIGDELLKLVSSRLQQVTREEDTIGRLSGDEFLLITENLKQIDDAAMIAEKIVEELVKPFDIHGQTFNISASIGISIFPDDSSDVSHLIKTADIAMYSAKTNGKNQFRFFSEEVKSEIYKQFINYKALDEAIDKKNLALLYQPRINLHTGTIDGVEVLLRLISKIGQIPPIFFLPAIEESGTIDRISQWVIYEVCKQIQRWDKAGIHTIPVSINLSGHQLASDSLLDIVQQNIRDFEIDPKLLEFEIPESSFEEASPIMLAHLKEIREMGCAISIDDFGTGSSSLPGLKHQSVTHLKIDKFLIDNLVDDADDRIIVHATISMAKKLGMQTIAEGVETKEQEKILKELGCDAAQGYVYSRPVRVDAITSLIEEAYRL